MKKRVLLFFLVVALSMTLCACAAKTQDAPGGGLTATDIHTITAATTPKTMYTTAPAVQRHPNLADKHKDSVYVDSRMYGGCLSLTGDVKITVVFVDDKQASWDAAAVKKQKAACEKAAKTIEKAAKKYGQALSISFVYTQATVSGVPSLNDDGTFAKSVLKAAGLPAIDALNDTLEQQYKVKEAPVVFAVNHAGRSYASPNYGGEHVVLHTNSDAFMHELYHVFGAEDFYFPEKTKQAATSRFGKSIMITSEQEVVDSLTAYLIGWTDTLDSNAKGFLEDTDYLTSALLSKAYEEETFTGYVTNRDMGTYVYTGNLVEGMRGSGKATLVYDNGDKYVGDQKDGDFHGQGTYTWKGGNKYTGAWVNGERTGQGTYVSKEGNTYVGSFSNGKYHGQGTYTWKSGEKYVGAWVNGERTGQGTYETSDGVWYSGGFKKGQFHGTGTYIWASGDKYVGDWVNGDRTGTGTMTWTNGVTYKGDWKNDSREGQGTMQWADGSKYVGSWKANKQHGQGTHVWSNGDKYVGEWAYGLQHGYGTYTWSDGGSQSGAWNNGKFLLG